MSPTITEGDFFISVPESSYERDDLVIYKLTKGQAGTPGIDDVSEDDIWLGKIAGLPNETVEIAENALKIDGNELFSISQELRSAESTEDLLLSPQRIPKDHFFVLMHGGTGASSRVISTPGLDSRQFGFISSEQLRKIVKIYSREKLLPGAASEMLFGALMVLYILIVPPYIRSISVRSILLSFIMFANYLLMGFFIVFMMVANESPFYYCSKLLIISSSFYQGAMAHIFGDGLLSIMAQGSVAVAGAILLFKSLRCGVSHLSLKSRQD